MRRPLVIAVLASSLAPAVAAADLRVTSTIALERPDGTAVPVAQNLRVWCGPWEPGIPARTLHVRAGSAPGRSGRSRPWSPTSGAMRSSASPNSFVFDEPTGAQLFAVDGTNEASSGEEEASGRITFGKVRCGPRLAVRFRVRAVLGSEFFDGGLLHMRGTFRASK